METYLSHLKHKENTFSDLVLATAFCLYIDWGNAHNVCTAYKVMSCILYLSLMSFCSPMEMKESVTICTQIPTDITQNDCGSFTIIMVITHWLKKKKNLSLLNPSFPSSICFYLPPLIPPKSIQRDKELVWTINCIFRIIST